MALWQEGDTPNYIDEIGLFRVGDIRLKADWRASTKELHLYDEDGTTSLGTMEATYGQTVPTLSEIPTKAGYDFTGYTAEDGTLYYDAFGHGMVVWKGDKDINLKASWTSAQVEISLDVNGGDEVAQPIMATYKGKYPELPEIKRMGYTLLGWTLQDDAADNYVTTDTVVDTYEPHTLVAQWAPNTNTPYVIEFYVESVSQNDVSVSENDTSEDTTEDAVYYELYTAQTLYGTTGATVSVDDWKSYQIPGYTIDLANKESVLLDTIKRTGTTVLKLYYRKAGSHIVTFTYGNGLPSETIRVSQGEFIDLPGKETANHMSMAGWSDGSVFYDASFSNYCVEGDVEFTALWEKETYQISYRNNAPSGSGAYEDFQYQTLTYDTPSKVMHNLFTITPVKDEEGNYTKYYEFTGWNTKADGTGTTYKPGDELLNVTVDDYYNDAGFLYAQWQEKDVPEGTVPYYVMYNMEDTTGMPRAEDYLILFGKVGETTEAVAYEFDNLTAQDFAQKTITYDPDAAKTGEAAEAADEENQKYGFYGYTVVEIKYARDRYALNLDYDGGQCEYEGSVSENNLSKEVIGGQYIGDIANLTPEKEGYTFLGWDVQIPSYMPLHEINAVAQYKVDNLRAVTVEYYTENLEDNGYTLASSETVYAEKGDTITPQPITFEGFKTPEAKTIDVPEDGSGVCQYYYDRETYTLSWNAGSGTMSGEDYSKGEVKYGAKITAPTLSREGYEGRWRAFTGTMPAQNITYRPEWKAQTVEYHVMYRMQERTGTDTTTYKTLYSQCKEAKAGSIVTMESELSDEYAAEVATGYRKPMEQVAEIAGDGSTTIYFDYDLYKSYLSYDFAGGTPTTSNYAAPGNYYYGHTLQIPLTKQVEKQGCEVVGWYDTSDPEQTIISGITITMGEKDVTYRLKWKRKTYNITYDLGEVAEEGAKNPNNPATYQTGCDFNIAGAVCEGMAFEGWEWAGDGDMPSGVELLKNGLVHVTEDATGDIRLKATWSDETRIFAAAMYDAQDAPVYTYHYPVRKAATLTLAEIAPPQREGYLFSYWTKKVPKEDYGYYTIILENDTKIADLNLNTDFVTACWMEIVEKDGKKLISVKDKREFDIALAYLKADPEYQGIYITGTVNLGDMEKPILETWDEGYLLYGGGGRYCDLSVQSTGVSLFTENRGEIKNVQVSVASARSYDTENGTYYGVMTKENYGKIYGCAVSSGLIESDVTYLGGIAGLNKGTIENCFISSLKVMWNDVTASSSGKTLAYVGGIAGCNAVDGVIEGCHVNRSSVFTKSNYIKNQNPALKMYMGGVAGTNQGRIEKCKVLVSKVGDNIQIYSDTNVYGYLCAGGIAGIDAQQGEPNVAVRGIYKSDVVSSQVKSAAVAGGVIGESNYGMLAGNLTSSVTVNAVFGHAGQVAAIYRSNQYSQFWDRNIVEKGDTISKYGVVGFIALFEPTDLKVLGCEVVDIADMKSTFTVGGRTTGHNRGYAQYVCKGDRTELVVLDTSYLEKKPSGEKKEEWVGDVGMSMD